MGLGTPLIMQFSILWAHVRVDLPPVSLRGGSLRLSRLSRCQEFRANPILVNARCV
jgi:hypothetical protein